MNPSSVLFNRESKIVIAIKDGYSQPFDKKTALSQDIIQEIWESAYNQEEMESGGIKCEILAPGFQDWKSGKLRICLEFIPDHDDSHTLSPDLRNIDSSGDSPLDKIRQSS